MITKEQARENARKKAAEIREERQNLIENFCETTATPIIEERAKNGEYYAEVGCDSEYANEIANNLRLKGEFSVRIDSINSKDSKLFVCWAD